MVRDQQRHTLGDLKKEDFQVFDNGKPRVISGFTIEKRGLSQGSNTESDVRPTAPNNARPPRQSASSSCSLTI